jgi:UDP-N-acetylmuramoylalanine--D-glutamate ligase
VSGGRALVMGLGSFGGGLGAARWLVREGLRVTVTDLRPADELEEALGALDELERATGRPLERVLGGHREEDFAAADLVVANPAVRPDHPLLALARGAGARVTSATELLLQNVRARFVCVTGTQGKSSTCHVLHQLLQLTGCAARLGGNFGGSLLDAAESIEPDEVLVLELSSYQLEALSPDVSADRVEAVCVTNVLADHLERHGDLEAYAAAKRRILDLLAPGGTALLPAGDPRLASWLPPLGRRATFGGEGADAPLRVEEGRFRFEDEELGRVADLALPGSFQVVNALSALGLARLLGARPDELARALPEVRGLEHRLEPLGSFGGRRVHDNGVSTTPDSTVAALLSLPPGVHLVLGGRGKGLPLDELARTARERVERAVCFGEEREALARALGDQGVDVARAAVLEEAVADVLAHAPPGADVLFSPACASFDAYPNFRARALAFRAALPEPDPA